MLQNVSSISCQCDSLPSPRMACNFWKLPSSRRYHGDMRSLWRTLLSSGAPASGSSGCPVRHDKERVSGGNDGASNKSSESACPVMHGGSSADKCPVAHNIGGGGGGGSGCGSDGIGGGGGCPVVHGGGGATSDAAVLNPLNRMPAAPAQQRAPGQTADLPTDRVESTIPNGSGSNWVYPSEQMFYNALQRKGKGDGVDAHSMGAVVAIHNNMNERAWKRVLEWESAHDATCALPRRLVRFLGRPDDLSPKAAANYYLGRKPRPFDRHDWTVDRCGKEVRYIIDYYDVASARERDRVPTLQEEDAVPSIEVDARPALDSSTAAFDRLRAMIGALPSEASAPAAPAAVAADTAIGSAAVASAGSGVPLRESAPLASSSSTTTTAAAVREACAAHMAELQACTDDASCTRAHMGLIMCMAQQVCAGEADAFTSLRGRTSDEATAQLASERYHAVERCVERWAEQASG